MFKRITELSRSLNERRNNQKREISILKETNNFQIIFPSYPFDPNNLLLQTLPWGHNGFLLEFGRIKIIVDPGYDFLARCLKDNLPIYSYNTLFVSHSHIDHYASANVMIEVMSLQKNKTINVLAPNKVFKDRAISTYHSNFNKKGEKNISPIILKNKKLVLLDRLEIYPIKLFHTITETMGCIYVYKNKKIGYISDTGYTKQFATTKRIYSAGDAYEGDILAIKSKHHYIKKAFREVDILIVNVNDFLFNNHSKYHLSGIDLIDILKNSKIKECYITHLNAVSSIHKAFLNDLQKVIEEETNIQIKCIGENGPVKIY